MAQIEIRLLPMSYRESPEIVLNEGSYLIGRETQMFRGFSEIRRKKLSREHGRLEIHGTSVCLFDLCSTNGTKINDVPIIAHESNLIADGDVINFANVFEYRLKIVSCSAEDTVITQITDDHGSRRPVVSNETLFLASADSYLDMLYDEDHSGGEEAGQQSTRKNNPLFIVLITLSVLTIIGSIAFYWISY